MVRNRNKNNQNKQTRQNNNNLSQIQNVERKLAVISSAIPTIERK